MPFKRRYRRNRRKGGYRRTYKKRPTTKSNRREIIKLKRSVETKHFTRVVEPFDTSTIPAIFQLQPFLDQSQGVDVNSFIGDRYHTVGVSIKGFLRKLNASAPGVDAVRFIGLWVKKVPSQQSVSFGNYYDQLDDNTSVQVSIKPYNASLRSSQAKNVKVLFDRKMDMGIKDALGPFAAGVQMKSFSFYVPINKRTTFESDLGANRITEGQFLLIVVSPFGDQVNMEFVTKYYFKDA